MAKINIVEVGPRDGLQNEKQVLDLDVKLELIRRLLAAGSTTVEIGSFVNPARLPQMANSDELYLALRDLPSEAIAREKHFPVLVPNIKGIEKAISLGVKEISCFTAASDTFNEKNIGCNIDESFKRIEQLIQLAKQHDIIVRGYLSCIVACPYEGMVDKEKVLDLTQALLELGCYEVSLGDTIGVATPGHITKLLNTLLNSVQADTLALHLHDTYGQALANNYVGFEMGIRTFDSAIAGLGGCPYAPGASGNVATEDLVYMFHGMELDTGIDLQSLVEAGDFISKKLGRVNQSRYAQATAAQRIKRS